MIEHTHVDVINRILKLGYAVRLNPPGSRYPLKVEGQFPMTWETVWSWLHATEKEHDRSIRRL